MNRNVNVRKYVMAACAAASLVLGSGLQAQAPAAQPRGASAAPRLMGMENGLTYFQTRCMSCHRENDSSKAPSARRIRQMTPEQIYAVVSKPSRPEHDQGLTDPQKRRMSEFMGGYRQIGSVEAGNPKNFPNACASNPPMSDPYAGAFWSGWGADIENTRYQRTEAAGITKAEVPKLKLKWAFGFPLGISAYSPPAIASGRVFVGTDIGWVYSLDAKTGCYYWGYETGVTVRPAISIGPVTGQGNTKYAVFFGDAKANVYALDAQNGKLLWKRKVDEFFLARITAAPKLYNGRLYVPVSSSEEWQSGNQDYECCTSRGSVVALNANSGEELWKTYVDGRSQAHAEERERRAVVRPGGRLGVEFSNGGSRAPCRLLWHGRYGDRTRAAPGRRDRRRGYGFRQGSVVLSGSAERCFYGRLLRREQEQGLSADHGAGC